MGATEIEALFVLSRGLAAICRPAQSLRVPGEPDEAALAGRCFSIRFRSDQSLRRVAEILGIPRCEIGAAFVDGEAWALEAPVSDGSRVELMGADEAPPGSAPPVPAPPFILDVHLGRLARDLRLLGFDVRWANDLDDAGIVRIATAEGRVVLTRDRGLLFRKSVGRAMLVRSRDPYEQLVDAMRRFDLARSARPFSLCSSCGAPVAPVPASAALTAVPSVVAARYGEFFACGACGKFYWRGDHFRNIEPFLERLAADLGVRLGAGPR